MRFSFKKWLQVLLSLAVAIWIFWYLYKDIKMEALWQALSETSFFWIGVSVLISIVGFWLRAWRWKLLIGAVNEITPPTKRVFWALMIGYLANLLVPRAGEVARCGVLKKSEDIQMGNLFGTVILERTIDLIFMFLTVVLAFFIERELFASLFSQLVSTDLLLEKIMTVLPIFIGLVIVFLIIIYVLFRVYKERNLVKKIRHFFRDLIKGLISLRKVRNQSGFWFSSIAIWVTYYLTMFFVAMAIPSTASLSPSAVLMVMVMGSIGMVAPVQGGIGTFHALVAFILMAYGLTNEEGKIFAVIIHGSQVLIIIVLGLVALLLFLKYTATKRTKIPLNSYSESKQI